MTSVELVVAIVELVVLVWVEVVPVWSDVVKSTLTFAPFRATALLVGPNPGPVAVSVTVPELLVGTA